MSLLKVPVAALQGLVLASVSMAALAMPGEVQAQASATGWTEVRPFGAGVRV